MNNKVVIPDDVRPSYFGLNHSEFRPAQLDTIKYIYDRPDGSVTLLQAVVGSGKTAIAKSPVAKFSTTAVVHTKSLQGQYHDSYAFDVVFGRANYPCVHPERENLDDNASHCIYEGDMDECEYADECPYLVAKRKAMQSKCRVINYAYMNTARWVKLPQFSTKYLFLDECHNLPNETLEFVSCTIREGDRIRWRLPEFPSVYDSSREGINLCLKWMEQSVGILMSAISDYKKVGDSYSKAQASKGERLAMKLMQTCKAVHTSQDDWYSRSGLRTLMFNDKQVPGLIVKPLTARHHFPKLFLGIYSRTVLMSATIGNHVDFAEELGITKYEYHSVPNQWKPEQRPVHVLDVPSMGQSVTEAGRVKHAEAIAKAINDCPSDWSGIIHVTSWKSAWDIRTRLAKAGVKGGRLFIPDRGGTNKQIAQWNEVRDNGVGKLIITPSMGAGVDLLSERINICAKVPFGFFVNGGWEWERMQFSNRFYRWQTAATLEQQMGRTRRGRAEDYDSPWERNGYVAIADGSFKKMGLARSCSKDFTDSLVYE